MKKQLRIGNLIEDELAGNLTLQVTGIIEQHCFVKRIDEPLSYDLQWGFIQPIPLTEEWLVRMGFKKKKYFGEWTYNDIITFYKGLKQGYLGCPHPEGEDIDVECKHVHQLQNLYYALTGKELSISQETKSPLGTELTNTQDKE